MSLIVQLLEPVQAVASMAMESDGDNRWALLLAGPIAGFAFYSITFMRYRNTDKRHAFEHETSAQMLDVDGSDRKVGEVKGTRDRFIEGDMKHQPLRRLGENSVILEKR
ncbi:hypothetical protein ABYF34_08975 [Buchananella felis]|uniref:hypothetical protein n=1 Tax=Buchananella felis TaxID=3231492 RepID=UPI0035282D49